jgi:transposase
MPQNADHVGCDVSKDWIDVMVLGRGERFRVGNDESGRAEVVERLLALAPAAIGVEASGGYERALIRALLGAGLPARQVNPYQLRRFAQALGIKAKSDRLDAEVIARFVATLPTRPAVRAPEIERLAELVLARQQLCEDKVRIENQAEHARAVEVERLCRRRLRALALEIALLDKRIAALVAADPVLAARDRLLRSAPGVGPVFSHTLIALMPELGQLTPAEAAALLGVAPFDHDSGKLKGQRCIWGGRMRVRNVAYMAAMSAMRHNPVLAETRQRLKAKGKAAKVVIVAVMRRLITILNAMLRDGTPWRAEA